LTVFTIRKRKAKGNASAKIVVVPADVARGPVAGRDLARVVRAGAKR
jgi:hypothetical protein